MSLVCDHEKCLRDGCAKCCDCRALLKPYATIEIDRLKRERDCYREALENIVDDPGIPVENNEAVIALRMNLLAHKALARGKEIEGGGDDNV